MNRSSRWHIPAIFLGDVVLFYAALSVSVWLRGLFPGDAAPFNTHLVPFTYIFAIWVVVYYIASLYEPHTVVFKSKLPGLILNAQAANSLIAVLFFYLIPAFGLTPKTILFIDLVVTIIFIATWRIFGVALFGLRHKEPAVLIGTGSETHALYKVVNESPIYPLRFATMVDIDKLDGIDFDSEVLAGIYSEGVTTIVIDLENEKVAPILPKFYNLIFSHIRFVEQYRIYEDIFDKIPLSLIGYSWFLENVSSRAHFGYDVLKRIMDTALALVLSVPAALLAPFVALAIKIEDGGPIFYTPERVGKGNHPIRLYKFRTMTTMDAGKRLEDNVQGITKVGRILRATRIDELPQLWNVLRGELSLIGPRPEFPDLVAQYVSEIPYYNMRHLIQPGLSGWAQVHHDKPPQTVEETKDKLAYDLYYLKNRSFVLDLKIALKTIKTLLSRTGK